MAMGTTPAPEHDSTVDEQLRVQWPAEFATPEKPDVEDRVIAPPAIEKR